MKKKLFFVVFFMLVLEKMVFADVDEKDYLAWILPQHLEYGSEDLNKPIGYNNLFEDCMSHRHKLYEETRSPIKAIEKNNIENNDKFVLYYWVDPETNLKYVYFKILDIQKMKINKGMQTWYKTKKLLFTDNVGIIKIPENSNRNTIMYTEPYYTEVTCYDCKDYRKPILWLPNDYILEQSFEDLENDGSIQVIPEQVINYNHDAVASQKNVMEERDFIQDNTGGTKLIPVTPKKPKIFEYE